MSRTDLQISRVLSRCKDKGEHTIQRDEVISEMNQVQKDLCKDYFAYKVDLTLTLTALQEEYILDATIYKVKEFIEPITWHCRIIPIHNSGEWANIKRNTYFNGSQPIYGFTWNRILRLFPAPTVTGDKLQVLAYALPSVDLDYGGDPEIDQAWDEALMLGTCKNLVGGDFFPLYEREAQKNSQQIIKESVNGIHKIEYSRSYF